MRYKVLQVPLKKHHQNAIKLLSKYKKNGVSEDLHQFRVEIKKLRALFSFSKKVYGITHSSAKLKPVFKHAGSLREAGIKIEMAKEHKSFPALTLKKLILKDKACKEEFRKHIPAYLKELNRVEIRSKSSKNINETKGVVHFFTKERRKAKEELKSKKREDMHEFRKRIKRLMYVFDVLPKKERKYLKFNKEKFDKIQHKVGEWHDTTIFLNFIEKNGSTGSTNSLLKATRKKEELEFEQCSKIKI